MFFPASAGIPGRKGWIQSPASAAPRGLLLFLDAEIYIEAVYAPSILHGLQLQGAIPPVSALYISHVDSAARQVDFTCNPDYSAFLSHQVSNWIHTNSSQKTPVIAIGLSLSGLATAHVAIQFPHLFRAVICQSPSMWWENERFRKSLPTAPDQGPKWWISVGDQETSKDISHPPSGLYQPTSQIDSCRRTWDALKTAGYNVQQHLFEGRHDPTCWREELPAALAWAMG